MFSASQPYPFYVSVRGDDASNWIPNILYSLIAYYTGVPVPDVQSTACKDLNVDDHVSSATTSYIVSQLKSIVIHTL